VFPVMTLAIAIMRSSLQASILSAGNQVVAIICKGRSASGLFQLRQLLWVIDLIVDGRGEDFKF
jgi:hypothetical protein